MILISNANGAAPLLWIRGGDWRVTKLCISIRLVAAIPATHITRWEWRRGIKRWSMSTPAQIQTRNHRKWTTPSSHLCSSELWIAIRLLSGQPKQLPAPKSYKKLNLKERDQKDRKVSKGDAAYHWSVRSLQPHRPPHQRSWTGNNEFCLSSLQKQNTGFIIKKRNMSKLGNRRIL